MYAMILVLNPVSFIRLVLQYAAELNIYPNLEAYLTELKRIQRLTTPGTPNHLKYNTNCPSNDVSCMSYDDS